MLLEKLIADVEARGGVSKMFIFILVTSLVTNAFMAAAYFTMDRTVRTLFIPPEVEKSFWVDGKRLGPEYLDLMGTWTIQQFATVTPASVDNQNASLLKLVDPAKFGELSIRFKAGANRLKAENMSKFFSAREVRISEVGQAIALIGTEQRWVADKRLPDKVSAYLVAFGYGGGRTTIQELRETDPRRPFEPPKSVVGEAEPALVYERAAVEQQPRLEEAPVAAPPPHEQTLPPSPPPPASDAMRDALQAGSEPTTPTSR